MNRSSFPIRFRSDRIPKSIVVEIGIFIALLCCVFIVLRSVRLHGCIASLTLANGHHVNVRLLVPSGWEPLSASPDKVIIGPSRNHVLLLQPLFDWLWQMPPSERYAQIVISVGNPCGLDQTGRTVVVSTDSGISSQLMYETRTMKSGIRLAYGRSNRVGFLQLADQICQSATVEDETD